LLIPILFLGLAANSIWDANEAFYVETPRQMLQSGDYINPSFNAEPRFNKPVLSYWIVALFYKAFGVSVGVERAPIALAMLGIVIAAWLLGRAIRSSRAGWVTAVVLLTAPRLIFFARRIAIDVFLTFFMTMALACFVMAWCQPARRRRCLLLMYAALGLGALTKGPIALVIPAVALIVFLALERRLSDLKALMLPAGAGIVLAIVLPWYVAIYAQHGWDYIRFFFVDENLGRYATALTLDRSPFFFLFALFGDLLLPWAPLLVIPIATAWRRGPAGDAGAAMRRLLWCWIATTVVIFSISASKEDLYILPAIPAAAVLIGDLLVSTEFGGSHRGVRAGLLLVALVTAAAGGLVTAFFTDGYFQLAGAPLMAIALVVGGLAALALAWTQPAAATWAIAASFAFFNYVFVLRALPDIERLKPSPALARAIDAHATENASLASLNVELPSLVYYTSRSVVRLPVPDDAVAFLNSHADAWLVTAEQEWMEIAPRVPGACLVLRRPLFLSKGSDIRRGNPPPDVLLISAPCRDGRVSGR